MFKEKELRVFLYKRAQQFKFYYKKSQRLSWLLFTIKKLKTRQILLFASYCLAGHF